MSTAEILCGIRLRYLPYGDGQAKAWARWTFLAGSIAATSTNIQAIFSSFSSIADQSLFLTDLHEIFAVRPAARPARAMAVAPRSIRYGFEFRNVTFAYPGTSRLVLDGLNMRWGTR